MAEKETEHKTDVQKLINQLATKKIRLLLVEDKLEVKAPKGAVTKEILEAIKAHKSELIAFLKHYSIKKEHNASIANVEHSTDGYALSNAQQRLWVLCQLEEELVAYNMPYRSGLNGSFHTDAFKQAVNFIIQRHEILRTVFRTNENGEVRQFIRTLEALDFSISEFDLRTDSQAETKLKQLLSEDEIQPFDLENGPLIRVGIVHLSDDKRILYYNLHHIICDGWSLEILNKEIISCYEDFVEGKVPALPELNIQYKDYASWQLQETAGENGLQHRDFWKQQFPGTIPILNLPAQYSRPKVKTFKGRSLSTYLSEEDSDAIRNFSSESGGTLFMGLFAVWNVLCARYSGQNDIIIGTPVAGRNHVELQNQIGFYVNTLALRNTIENDDSFQSFFAKLKENTLTCFEHESYPFDRVIDELQLERDTGRSAITDVFFTVQNKTGEAVSADFQSEEINDRGECVSKFDIEVAFQNGGRNIYVEVNFNREIYTSGFIAKLIQHYKQLLKVLVKNKQAKLSEVNFFTKEEEDQLLAITEGPKAGPKQYSSLISAFSDQAKTNADKTAIWGISQRLTFRALDEKSNRFANYLSSQVKKRDQVLLKLDRNEDFVASVLAILKLGATYVPIDPDYPEERIKFLEEDSDAVFQVTQEILEDFKSKANSYDSFFEPVNIAPTDLAYIIYTSGSTGKPKGVKITHQNVLSLVFPGDYIDLKPSDVLLATGSISFDISTFEIYAPLLRGASLAFCTKEELLDLTLLEARIQSTGTTVIHFIPALLNRIIDESPEVLSGISKLITGGDKVSAAYLNKLRQQHPELKVYHAYGPTESTTFTTVFEVTEDYQAAVPLGRPFAGRSVYILDANQRLVPKNVVGEICIGGAGISPGYYNSDALTAEKFIDHPYRAGEKLYRSGDYGKWLPDNTIAFLGRQDEQVKIRGHRVEIAEIEHIVNGLEAVNEAVVLAVSSSGTENSLAVFLLINKGFEVQDIREKLAQMLPEYMIPSYFVELEAFPLTANGKVDRNLLKKSELLDKTENIRYEAPRTEEEKTIVSVWQSVLNKEKVGINDDFFKLGGHSLKAVSLISQYHKAFDVKLPLSALFEHATPALHAGLILQSRKLQYQKIEKAQESDLYHVSPSQERLWLLNQLEGDISYYNLYGKKAFGNDFDLERFKLALYAVVKKHESLRTVFLEKEGIPFQKVVAMQSFEIPVYTENQRAEAERAIDLCNFKLNEWPLFKVGVVVKEDGYELKYCLHHIISDGWSMEVFEADLVKAYSDPALDADYQLPELDVQYKDYADWQNKLSQTTWKDQAGYWEEQLKGPRAYITLPADQHSAYISDTGGNASYYDIRIGHEKLQEIERYIHEYKISKFAFFIATFKILIGRITAEKDIIIGTPVANRDHDQLKDIIGLFLNTLMLRDFVDEENSFSEFARKVNKTLADGVENQSYPFEKVLEKLNISRDFNQFPISPVFLNMVDFNGDLMSLEARKEVSRKGNLSFNTKFDLEVYYKSFSDALLISLVYDNSLFRESTIAYWLNEYTSIIQQVLSTPDRPMWELNVFKNAHEEITYPEPSADFERFISSPNETLTGRFEQQVSRFPGKVAIHHNESSITYEHLNRAANILANEIDAVIKNTDAKIALLLEHGAPGITGMIAALKTGRCYIPLEPDHPKEYLKKIIEDTGCSLIITSMKYESLASELLTKNVEMLVLDKTSAGNDKYVSRVSEATSPAYILYTSGSTGTPKGVVQSHKNVLHFMQVYTNNLHISSDDRLSLLPTYTFDAAVMDIYGALLNGASLWVYSVKSQGIEALGQWLEDKEITIFHLVPTIYRYFIDTLTNEVFEKVRLIVLGGEAVRTTDFESFKKHFGTQSIFINGYGPTESTITTQKLMNRESEASGRIIPIGKPVSETIVYILNGKDQEADIYQVGEIAYKSDYLALEYFNSPELTEKSFTIDPITQNGRIYRSGDFGRKLPNGEIEFIGRRDSQVKINGQRIDLCEIEFQLSQLEEILEVVVDYKAYLNEHYLVAYYRSSEICDADLLRSRLAQVLPQQMIPRVYVRLESFPLTRTGKTDRTALPRITKELLPESAYIAPRNEMESDIVSIWESLLNKEKISVGDDFFAIGGNSLKAISLISRLYKHFDIKLELKEIFTHPTVRSLTQLLDSKTAADAYASIPQIEEKEFYELTDAQRRVWVLSQFEGASMLYNMPMTVELNQAIDLDAFKKAFNAVVERHESLRTVFRAAPDGDVKQLILSTGEIGEVVQFLDLSGEKEKHQKMLQNIFEDRYKAFDLENGPLIRVVLFRLKEDSYVLYYNMHHIVSDGWSLEVLKKDVMQYYAHFTSGAEAPLELKVQYKDYAAWLSDQMKSPENDVSRKFWLDTFSEEISVTDLPSSKKRPLLRTVSGRDLGTHIPGKLLDQLKEYAYANNGSLFTGLLAILNIALNKYTGESDFVIGTPVAGRTHLDLENQIGFYVNTLALRNSIDDSQDFAAVFAQINGNTLDAYNHQAYPFNKLVDELKLKRDTSRSALFDIMLTLQNVGDYDETLPMSSAYTDKVVDLGMAVSKFDLSLTFREENGLLAMVVNYNTDVYEKEVIEAFIIHFRAIASCVLDDPHRIISELDYLDAAEKREVIEDFNQTDRAFSDNKTLIQLLEEQVSKTPANKALHFEGKEYTYKELNVAADHVAKYLRLNYNIKRNDFVGIKLDRSAEMIITLLGILKTGAAYLPLDIDNPEERIQFILEDTGCQLVIDDTEWNRIAVFEAGEQMFPSVITSPEDACYVIYTSGTTGIPKGVVVNHRSVVNLAEPLIKTFGIDDRENILLMSNIVFDASVEQIFIALLSGSKLSVISKEIQLSPAQLEAYIDENEITHIDNVPHVIGLLTPRKHKKLKRLICGGDAVSVEMAKSWSPHHSFYNEYGPTETTVTSMQFLYTDEFRDYKSLPIGKPIQNTWVYILDKQGNPVPKFVPGEIFIAGEGVAMGYLNRPELDEEKFVQCPFGKKGRMYKTGDLGRWLPGGNIDCLGRSDNQVKIRGYRIELGEVENALKSVEGINDVGVIVSRNGQKDKDLIGFFTSGKELESSQVRNELKKAVPDYMIPAALIQLDEFPLTPSGKLDRKKLYDKVSELTIGSQNYIAPENEEEKAIVNIWLEVLDVQKVGMGDDFFDLGGHSLKAVKLIGEYHKVYDVKLTLKDVFSMPTIKEQLKFIKEVRELAGLDTGKVNDDEDELIF